MAQVFVVQQPGTRFPFRLHNPNDANSSVTVISHVSYPAIGVSFAPGTNGTALTAYAPNPGLFDTLTLSWLLLAVAGKAYPVLLKEKDFATIAAVITGDWAVLGRAADGQLYKIPQI